VTNEVHVHHGRFNTAAYSVYPNEDVLFDIAYADDALLVVEKPAGVVTQPGKKHMRDSLLNGLFARYGHPLQNLGEARQWGLLHRLDRDTSGLVIVALRQRAYDDLFDQFKNRRVKKTYWALVAGSPRTAQGVIQTPILEVVGARKKAIAGRRGKPAITAFRVLAVGKGVSLVEARPKTGRLHQIRVHFAEMGCPVVGEDVYADRHRLPAAGRLCLHAAGLSFVHPETRQRVTVRSPWPSDLVKTLRRVGIKPPTHDS
jgi:23S rRNA pseudouridine1911/1915/1917 synthase